MGKALYRSYRPKKLSEIGGQEHIVQALGNALKKDAISHAYLLTGPRGTGKTSTARILAHDINQLPYDGEVSHIDIIEIDAASNRRIDEIRDLRDKVHIAPAMVKYKVYIIDEVHMLTREAFNALLKTLEEPPAHVVFILATTEAHKLPETIISRTQRFTFKPVETDKVAGHLRQIATKEKIPITDEALRLVAQHGGGSFRDSISLLDQFGGLGREVTLDDVREALGVAPDELIRELVGKLKSKDPAGLASTLASAAEAGVEPAQTAKQLAQELRTGVVVGKPPLEQKLVLSLLAKLIEVPASRDPASFLEIALFDAALPASEPSQPTKKSALAVSHPATEVITEPHPSKVRAESQTPKPEVVEKPAKTQVTHKPMDEKIWGEVLVKIKQKYGTLHSILKMSEPAFGSGQLTILCSNAFNKKRLDEPRNKQAIADTIQELSGQAPEIKCELATKPVQAPSAVPPQKEAVKTEPDAVKAVSNIFGGAEVLE